MDQPANPQRKGVAVGLVICGVAGVLAAVPGLASLDMMNGGYALMVIAAFLGISGGVIAAVQAHRARVFDRMARGEGLLARWSYLPEEWARWAEHEHHATAAATTMLLASVTAIALLVGLVFLAADWEGGGPAVFAVMLGLIGACGLAAWLRVRGARRRRARVGDVWIARDGVLLDGELHTWSLAGSRLEGVLTLLEPVPQLVFTYSYRARHGTETVEVRVPVPSGCESEAANIALRLCPGRAASAT